MVPILVVLTIAVFLIVELTIAWRRRNVRVREAVPAYRIPEGLFFHGGHTWAHLTPAGEALVGMDDFAQAVIGSIDRIELPEPGTELRQGEKAFTVVQRNKRIDFVSPLCGRVSTVNERVNTEVGRLKEDPYGTGWLFAIRPGDIVHDLRKTRIARDAAAWLEKETARFAEFVTLHRAFPQEVGFTLPDGGTCVDGVVEGIDGELLHLLVRKFFR
ncbi:MAG TPA: glycine cleavage system protein H [Candidatus Deferrimicrobiaceae bacterium]|nr:glycine cleavage system protein H [Candidatus Deferrimicrobiaceae bacterium]